MKIKRVTNVLSLSLLVALSLSLGCGPSNPTGDSGVNVSTSQSGKGIIKGIVTAEGFTTSGFRIKGIDYKQAKVKASSNKDTKEVNSKADGSFEMEVEGGADYKLEAIVPDGKGGTLKVVSPLITVPLAKDPPIVDVKSLVTRQTGSIQGLILIENGGEGESLEGADVYIAGTSIVGKARDKGRFALTEVAAGTWDIVISKPGYERFTVKGVEVQPGKARLVDNVILKKSSQISSGVKGTIQDNSGAAIAGSTITVYAKGNSDNFTAISNDKGEFQLVNIPAGDYQLQVYRAFYELPARKEIKIDGNVILDAGVTKLKSNVVFFGKVKGQVIDEDGKAVDSAVIQTLPQVTDQQFSDAAGNFNLDRVLPGEYSASISAGGYCTVEMSLRVENVQDYQLNIERPIILLKKNGEDDCSQILSAGNLPVLPSPQKGNQEESLRSLLENPNPAVLKKPKIDFTSFNKFNKIDLLFKENEIVFERVDYTPGTGNIDYVLTSDIYLYNIAGQTNLTNDSIRDSAPKWSSNGEKIAWIPRVTGNTGISHPYIMNSDGSNRGIRSVGNNDINDIDWSPDNSKFVYSIKIDNITNNIYTMDNNGSNKVLLSPLNAVQPNWSSTNKIAFKSGYDIYTINADGSNQRKLTTNTESNANNTSAFVIDSQPNWSPDGSKIAFTRTSYRKEKNVVELYIMNADGSNVRQLTNKPDEASSNPNWSPDGKKIIFQSQPLTGLTSNYAGINIINSDYSGNRYVLLENTNTRVYKSPDWRKVQ